MKNKDKGKNKLADSRQNLVAKHAKSYNKSQVHRDRKKAAKSGYQRFSINLTRSQDDSKAA